MTTERKTELGRDLQRRADTCLRKADASPTDPPASVALLAKALAYEHAAELVDAAYSGSIDVTGWEQGYVDVERLMSAFVPKLEAMADRRTQPYAEPEHEAPEQEAPASHTINLNDEVRFSLTPLGAEKWTEPLAMFESRRNTIMPGPRRAQLWEVMQRLGRFMHCGASPLVEGNAIRLDPEAAGQTPKPAPQPHRAYTLTSETLALARKVAETTRDFGPTGSPLAGLKLLAALENAGGLPAADLRKLATWAREYVMQIGHNWIADEDVDALEIADRILLHLALDEMPAGSVEVRGSEGARDGTPEPDPRLPPDYSVANLGGDWRAHLSTDDDAYDGPERQSLNDAVLDAWERAFSRAASMASSQGAALGRLRDWIMGARENRHGYRIGAGQDVSSPADRAITMLAAALNELAKPTPYVTDDGRDAALEFRMATVSIDALRAEVGAERSRADRAEAEVGRLSDVIAQRLAECEVDEGCGPCNAEITRLGDWLREHGHRLEANSVAETAIRLIRGRVSSSARAIWQPQTEALMRIEALSYGLPPYTAGSIRVPMHPARARDLVDRIEYLIKYKEHALALTTTLMQIAAVSQGRDPAEVGDATMIMPVEVAKDLAARVVLLFRSFNSIADQAGRDRDLLDATTALVRRFADRLVETDPEYIEDLRRKGS